MTTKAANMSGPSTEVADTAVAEVEDAPTGDDEAHPEGAGEAVDAGAVVIDRQAGEVEVSANAVTEGEPPDPRGGSRRVRWGRVLAYGFLPALALILAIGAGYLKWLDATARDSHSAATESVRVAADDVVALLSYNPDTVERDLNAARDRLTGEFKNSYTGLIHDVVIPGSKQKQISALANVPAAAPISGSSDHAVVLVFVNQTVTVGNDPPTSTASSVRVTLDKIGGRWLISQFEPV